MPVIGTGTPPLPPHARGCTPNTNFFVPSVWASPARAGMYLRRPRSTGRSRRFPRTRGDVPVGGNCRGIRHQLPPHARGCTQVGEPLVGEVLASPARAGMYRRGTADGCLSACFPRTRGDVPRAVCLMLGVDPLPPHARGCTRHRFVARNKVGASPARAGMYLAKALQPGAVDSFPRTRGDVPACGHSAHPSDRLPPHARGCTV